MRFPAANGTEHSGSGTDYMLRNQILFISDSGRLNRTLLRRLLVIGENFHVFQLTAATTHSDHMAYFCLFCALACSHNTNLLWKI